MNITTWMLLAITGAAAATAVYFWRKTKASKTDGPGVSNLTSVSEVANSSDQKLTFRPRPPRTIALGYFIEPKRQKSTRSSPAKTNRLAIARKDCPIFVIAPPSSGKTTAIVTPAILDWEGPVLTTSVKYDTAKDTWKGRRLSGETHIFDPAEELLKNPDPELTTLRRRWTPLANCGTMREAMDVGEALVAGGSSNSLAGGDTDFWKAQAASVIGVLLWLTRLKPGTTMNDVNRRVSELGQTVSSDPDDDESEELLGWDVVARELEDRHARFERLLEIATDADKIERAQSELEEVEAAINEWMPLVGVAKSAPQTIGGVLANVGTALRPVRSARELRKTPWDAPDLLDIGDFLLSSDTIYVVSPFNTGLFAPILTAFTQTVIDEAFKTADSFEKKRLPRELLCALDEVPSISPMPRLPQYSATARSYGIQLLCIAQSVVQAEERWGKEAARALLSNSTGAFVLMPKTLDDGTLEWFSKLFGETRFAERSTSKSTTVGSSWGNGARTTHNESTSESVSTSYTWRSIASVGKLRGLHEKELAVVCGEQAFQAVQRRWFEDEDLRAYANGDAEAKERLRTKYQYVDFDS